MPVIRDTLDTEIFKFISKSVRFYLTLRLVLGYDIDVMI